MRRRGVALLGTGLLSVCTVLVLTQLNPDQLNALPRQLERHAGALLLWRLLIYGALAWLWWQLDHQQQSCPVRTHWRRLGLICALLITGIELSRSRFM
jgi:hypothetical protein